MFLLLWAFLLFALFFLPILVFAPRWGAPWPYAYRQRRGRGYGDRDTVQLADAAHDQTPEDPWWYWADILWFVFLVLLVWLVVVWLV